MVRRIVFLAPIVLVTFLAAGCGPSQRDIESSIRTEMKTKLAVTIASFDLKKQPDGTYLGTATAENTDVYDVNTFPAAGNGVQWKAVPGQAMVEKIVRAGLEQQMGGKVLSLQLTRNGPGDYIGPAELSTQLKMQVTTRMEGTNLKWEAKAIKQ